MLEYYKGQKFRINYKIIGTYSGQSDLHTWIVTSHIVVYTLSSNVPMHHQTPHHLHIITLNI